MLWGFLFMWIKWFHWLVVRIGLGLIHGCAPRLCPQLCGFSQNLSIFRIYITSTSQPYHIYRFLSYFFCSILFKVMFFITPQSIMSFLVTSFQVSIGLFSQFLEFIVLNVSYKGCFQPCTCSNNLKRYSLTSLLMELPFSSLCLFIPNSILSCNYTHQSYYAHSSHMYLLDCWCFLAQIFYYRWSFLKENSSYLIDYVVI